MRGRTLPLSRFFTGEYVEIISLPRGILRSQFIRVGLNEGEKIHCFARLPGGTMIIRKNRQQIAIGHQLANMILVLLLEQTGDDDV